MNKITDITEQLNVKKRAEKEENRWKIIKDKCRLETVNEILQYRPEYDYDEIQWFEDTLIEYDISILDFCYDVLTLSEHKFNIKYHDTLLDWDESAGYVLVTLFNLKNNDEENEYENFFEKIKNQGKARKIVYFSNLQIKKETEQIIHCLKQGKEGVMLLIDQQIEKGITNSDVESLDRFIEFIGVEDKRLYKVFSDALRLDSLIFYKLHEINWYIAVDKAIIFLAILKLTIPEQFKESFNNITERINDSFL